MGQSSSNPQVTANYTDPLHLRLHFHYDPSKSELYEKPRPYTTAQVAKLVRSDWPTFFNTSIAFGGGCDSPEERYKSDDIVDGRVCLYIPPKRIRLTSADIREVRSKAGSSETATPMKFCIDIVTHLVKNSPNTVQTYVDKVSPKKYLVRVGDSYPLDALIHDAFLTVQHRWMSGGWLQGVGVAHTRSTNGRGDIYPDTTRGAPLWYEYVPSPKLSHPGQLAKYTRKQKLMPAVARNKKPTRKAPTNAKRVIRFTGFRDPVLAAKLEAKGHEVTTGSMTKRVSVVVWDGTRKSRSVQEAEARPNVALWRREDALTLA